MTENSTMPLELVGEKTVELEAGPIHYREIGQGETLVFVHGLLVNGMLWRKVVPKLAQRYRCIVPDLPLGSHVTPMSADADLSPTGLADIIGDFLEALELDAATLVANDTGGALTQILAASRPERIGRLVLTPCDMFDNFLPAMFRPLQIIGSTPLGVAAIVQPMRLAAVRRSPLAFGWLAKHGIAAALSERYLQPAATTPAIRRDISKILRGISSRYTQQAATELSRFDRPTLIVWAREDRFFPLEHAQRMAAILPDARIEVVEDSYTFVSEDQPERLEGLIRGFVG